MNHNVFLTVVGRSNPGGRPSWYGHVRHLGPLRQSVPLTRQEEEVRDQSAQKNAKPCLQ